MTTKQIETAVVVGTVTGDGNAKVTVTAYGMGNSPKAISVAVLNLDTASDVAGKIRTALAFDADVSAMFLISGTGANVVLTKHVASANDSTVNIAIANDTCTGLTAAPTSTNTLAGDGLENAYCTVAEVKATDVLNFSDATHDVTLESIINAVSRLIDQWCGRRFFATVETRYYRSDDERCLRVNDIANNTSFALYTDDDGDGVYENTWTTSDYDFEPYNAALDGMPYTELVVKPLSSLFFPDVLKGTKVTANFGWASVPKPINRACVLQAARLFKRYTTPLGVQGATAIGTITMQTPGLDQDVKFLLQNYVRYD